MVFSGAVKTNPQGEGIQVVLSQGSLALGLKFMVLLALGITWKEPRVRVIAYSKEFLRQP